MTIKISVAIMYHPSRAARLPKLIESCAPLVPRPVVDPDPGGIKSPLRTSRAAWSAIADGATHHMVIQDDVILTAGFANHLLDVVKACPDSPIALYSNWNGPQNSYLIRRAAAAGSALTLLSPAEWAPTEALILPVGQAREMAELFRKIPDEFKDDDELVSVFFRKHEISLLGTVPHLVDHADEGTLSGHSGAYRATVYADEYRLLPEHWMAGARNGLTTGAVDVFVELSSSQCLLRFSKLSMAEPIEHPYGWYWYDACAMLNIAPEHVLDDFRRFLHDRVGSVQDVRPQLGSPTVLEIWAACYLLGWDTAAEAIRGDESGVSKHIQTSLLPLAIGSWLDCGMHPVDAERLDHSTRTQLIDVGLAAIHSSRNRHAETHGRSTSPGTGDHHSGHFARLVRDMAEREASSQLLTPPYVPASSVAQEPHLALLIRPCAECGAFSEPPRSMTPLLRNGHAVLADGDGDPGLPVVEMLGCEALTSRALLPVTVLFGLIGDSAAGTFSSRAAAWADRSVDPDASEEEMLAHIREINAYEAWASVLCISRDKKTLRRVVESARNNRTPLVLPASTRHRAHVADSLAPHFLTTHNSGSILVEHNARYLEIHRQLIRTACRLQFGE